MTIEILSGKVKYESGKVLNTQNGPRINAVISLPDGRDVKLWGDAGDSSIERLKKGEPVEVVKTQNGGFKLVSRAEEMHPEPASAENPKLSEMADKLAECFHAIKARCPNLSEDSTKTMAISLFIQLSK